MPKDFSILIPDKPVIYSSQFFQLGHSNDTQTLHATCERTELVRRRTGCHRGHRGYFFGDAGSAVVGGKKGK